MLHKVLFIVILITAMMTAGCTTTRKLACENLRSDFEPNQRIELVQVSKISIPLADKKEIEIESAETFFKKAVLYVDKRNWKEGGDDSMRIVMPHKSIIFSGKASVMLYGIKNLPEDPRSSALYAKLSDIVAEKIIWADILTCLEGEDLVCAAEIMPSNPALIKTINGEKYLMILYGAYPIGLFTPISS